MVLVKVLKRKDASSVFVAVLLAWLIWQPLMQVTARPAGKLLSLKDNQYVSYSYPGTGWKVQYLYPVVQLVMELIVLEVLAWIYIWTAGSMKKK